MKSDSATQSLGHAGHPAAHRATRPVRRLRLAGATLVLALGLGLVVPARAQATPLDDLKSLQEQIQTSNAAYEDATARVEELDAQISANQERAAQIQADMPVLKQRATDSMRVLYKMQQGTGGLIELLLSAENFNELVSTIQYLDVIQSHNSDAVAALAASAAELERTQAALDAERAEAEAERQEAADALAAAEAARAQVQAQIDAQAAAEAAERQAALEAAQAAIDEAQQGGSEGPTFETESGGKAEVEVPADPDPEPAPAPSDKASFVALWAPRIDAYLAGSPMAGTGETFAEAAWTYGVDPRFSPAISAVESSKGLYCFKSHNAWGWGSVSWGSWEEAIWDHVAGLAAGYGGQLTYAAAQKYCPPNAGAWYSSVLANMEKI